MSNGEKPEPPKIEWEGTRSPEEVDKLNKKVLFERGFKAPDMPNRPNPLEGLDPQIIELARIKAEQIATRASDIEQISALAHIDKVISGKTPHEMIEALDDVILASAGKSQLAPEIELALAFLAITDTDPNETQ